MVSKVCTELENHLGLNDKDLAEFIIHLAEKNDTFDKFKSVLLEASGGSFADSFIANLLRIIQRLNPSMRQQKQAQSNNSTAVTGPVTGGNFKTIDPGVKKVLCPALALPNEKFEQSEVSSDENEKEKIKESFTTHVTETRDRKRKKSPKNKHRSRSRSQEKNKKKRSRSRSRSRTPPNKSQSDTFLLINSKLGKHIETCYDTEPKIGEIYDGMVTSIMQFGCFVQLKNFRKKTEGLVHLSHLREEGRVNIVTDVVSRHQKVKVKVLSVRGKKISLSMKEVDQFTGLDLNTQSTYRLMNANEFSLYDDDPLLTRNPDRPNNVYDAAPVNEDDDDDKKGNVKVKNKQISDFEKWELQQLRNANAIQLKDMPNFDEENGILQNEEEIEDIEIELVEDECVFLKGYGT